MPSKPSHYRVFEILYYTLICTTLKYSTLKNTQLLELMIGARLTVDRTVGLKKSLNRQQPVLAVHNLGPQPARQGELDMGNAVIIVPQSNDFRRFRHIQNLYPLVASPDLDAGAGKVGVFLRA